MLKKFLSLCLVTLMVLSLLSTAMVTAVATTAPSFTQVTYNSSKVLYDYSDFDFSSLGENLIKDPTVNCFKADGVTYENYYNVDATSSNFTVVNENACWGRVPADVWHHFSSSGASMYKSPYQRGYISSNTHYSHTADGSGSIVLPKETSVSNKLIPLPGLDTDSYYLITAWCKGSSSEMSIYKATEKLSGSVWQYGDLGTTDWIRVSMILYTGTTSVSYWSLGFYNSEVLYFDDAAVYKLSDGYGKECVAAKKLITEDEAFDKINRGYAPFGYGDRQYISAKTCDDEYNLIGNSACNDTSYWADTNGLLTITSSEAYEGNTSLKFSGSGTYRKTISGLKTDTYYYLSLYGKAYTNDVVTDIQFGMMSPGGLPFENPIGEWELSHWAREEGSKQEITIFCSDGTWYNRSYRFYTGKYTTLDFFVKGSKGEMYLDNIRIFEEGNAKSATVKAEAADVTIANVQETAFACNNDKNLIPNGDFENGSEYWENFNGFGKFVEVVTSSGNKMLHYKSANWGYHYMAKVDLKANTEYTFSYWTLNLNGEGAKFGLVGLMPLKDNNDSSPFEYISAVRNVSDDYGEWKLVSVRFTPKTDTTMALAVYDGGGEAVIDKVRLFKSTDGYEKDTSSDMPVGGEIFLGSKLGSDGIQRELPDDASAIQITKTGGTIHDYSNINYGWFGENLITDSTISAFDENGKYKEYYQLDENGVPALNENTGKEIILNKDAWWDNPANDWQVHFGASSAWNTMKTKGYTVKSGSRTNDGSGSINITSTNTQNYLALPQMQSKSYYLVSFWVKFGKASGYIGGSRTSNNEIAFMFSTSDSATVNYNIYEYSKTASSGNWERITFLVYTGNSSHSEPVIRIYNTYAGYVDDICVYKLNPYYGRLSYESKKLIAGGYENLGDVNDDGTVDTKDLVRLKKVLAGVTDKYAIMNIDVSCDGYVSSMDLVTLRKYLIGKISVFNKINIY